MKCNIKIQGQRAEALHHTAKDTYVMSEAKNHKTTSVKIYNEIINKSSARQCQEGKGF